MKNNYVIGVLGGMGTYATIHFFRQYAKVFSAEKEWERPRIIIDNRCTMPSRVRAYLYHENVDQLVNEMADSMSGLMQAGCNRIVLACNTSHLFLPNIYEKVPALKKKVINIIENCVDKISDDQIQEIYLLGSEGTIESQVYQRTLLSHGIKCLVPSQEDYANIRECIEAVKQNNYSETVKDTFLELLNRHDNCILGCTELPILYEKYIPWVTNKNTYDPLLLSLYTMKKEFENE